MLGLCSCSVCIATVLIILTGTVFSHKVNKICEYLHNIRVIRTHAVVCYYGRHFYNRFY